MSQIGINKDITLEDLGYKNLVSDDYVIIYQKRTKISIITLKFYTNNKSFLKEDELGLAKVITFEELQAIYNKCKEIGWLDE